MGPYFLDILYSKEVKVVFLLTTVWIKYIKLTFHISNLLFYFTCAILILFYHAIFFKTVLISVQFRRGDLKKTRNQPRKPLTIKDSARKSMQFSLMCNLMYFTIGLIAPLPDINRISFRYRKIFLYFFRPYIRVLRLSY